MIDIQDLTQTCQNSLGFFFKFISANETGTTGAHQSGFYMPRETWPLFFDSAGKKNENKDKDIIIRWDNGIVTNSRYIWYGNGTRSEYRLTRGVTFLTDDNIGDVLIFIKLEDDEFQGVILHTDSEIEDFFTAFGLSPVDACKLQFPRKPLTLEELLQSKINILIEEAGANFPNGLAISKMARNIADDLQGSIGNDYDKKLISWTTTEFDLFKGIENLKYTEYISQPFSSISELIKVANTILNRRKSRAGHSLEYHLQFIFDSEKIPYTPQPKTEGDKKPDFIFPGITEYHEKNYPNNMITMLAAKTTCKDRWRQILSEADRVEKKHLITLQQGISEKQLREMEKAKVILIVPKNYHKYYPHLFIDKLLSVNSFVQGLKNQYKC